MTMVLSATLLAGCAHMETLSVSRCDGVSVEATPARIDQVMRVAARIAPQHRLKPTTGERLAFLRKIHEESPEADNRVFAEWRGGRERIKGAAVVEMRIVARKRTNRIVVMITDETFGATDEQTIALRDAMRNGLATEMPECDIEIASRTDGPLWTIGP